MKKIILVNSIIAFFDRHKSLLNRSEFQILTAATGSDAIEVHRRERADMIIAELTMPDMQGDKLCSQLRKEEALKHVLVILACSDTPDNRARIARCGANDWVATPLDPEKLQDSISRLFSISMRMGYRVILMAKVHSEWNAVPFFCTSQNISDTGILIESDKILNHGDRITCRFFLPGACQVEANGEIVRSINMPDGSVHYGVRFIDMATEYRTAIESFVAQITRQA